jgi:hypothetical protein
MIDSGDSATTRASGISSVSTDRNLAVIVVNPAKTSTLPCLYSEPNRGRRAMTPTLRSVVRAGVPAAVAAALAVAVVSPGIAHADTCLDSATGIGLPLDATPCADVLAQEARWLTAITSGDAATVNAVLSPTYRHVNANGKMIDRATELAMTEPLDVTFAASDQFVDITGDTAVIRGVNTITQRGKVKDRQRFTDVFLLQHGEWMAVAAQETRI